MQTAGLLYLSEGAVMTNTLRLLVLPLLLLASEGVLPAPAHAGHPQYLLLRTPPSGSHHVSQGYNRGIGEGVSTPAYSYGYFGVQPRTHVSRHFGYYRNYTEWSRK